MTGFLFDLRLAARSLRRSGGFTAAAVLTLALGIGGTCAIFSVLDAVFLRPLPFANEGELIRLREFTKAPGGAISPVNINGRHFLEIAGQAKTLSGITAERGRSATLTGGDVPQRIQAVSLSPRSLGVLGVRPALGRTFLAAEEEQGESAGVALISSALWHARLGATPDVLARTLQIDGRTTRIVGVLPPGYRFPYDADVWLPGRVDAQSPDDYAVFARIAPGVSLEQAKSELAAIASRMRDRDPQTYPGYGIISAPLRESLVGDQDRMALALLVVLALFLLLACVDVTLLLLARSVARQQEFALRSALGASRGRQIRHVLTEVGLLACAGGVAGLVLAAQFQPLLWALVPTNLSQQLGLTEAPFHPRLLAFAVTVVVCAALLAGSLPALQGTRTDLDALLRGAPQRTDTAGRRKLMDAFVCSQIALAVLLVSGAALVIQNFRLLRRGELGFDEHQLLTAEIELPRSRYGDGSRRAAFVNALTARLAATPGIDGAGIITMNPLRGTTWSAPLIGEDQDEVQAASVYHRLITPGLLSAMRIPLLQGRDVSAADGPNAPPVAIVSARLAARLWPGADPIGKRLRLARAGSPWRTVIGVAGDVRERFEISEAWYLPYAQNAASPAAEVLELMVRSPVDPAPLAAAVRAAVAALDPSLALADVSTMEGVRAATLSQERVAAQTVSVFAALGLLLAAVGTYGVMAYAVVRRTRELAIRMALGAQPRAVVQLVLGKGIGLGLLGVAAGLGATAGLHRLVASRLSEAAASDARVYVAVSILILGVAAAATWLPARRALRVDPAHALRAE